jgi:uncharacterized repeat protein (TIGR03803 family)
MKHRGAGLSMFAFALWFIVMPATAQTYTPLYTYPGASNNTSGIAWPGLMSQGQDGAFYSTNLANGARNHGSTYKMTTAGQYTLLSSFCTQAGCIDGAGPYGGVTLATDGDFYGTTGGGGACDQGVGTIFKITSAGAWTKLWDFTAGTTCNGHITFKDEGYPYYPLIEGEDGNFYGTDAGVYSGTYGVFYKITPKGNLTPYPFSYSNGATPNLPTQGVDGNFYGTAQAGGDATCRCGVVYKVTSGGQITVLHKFTGYPNDGYRPTGVLVQGTDGFFYGTTYQGGAHNEGAVFKISAAGTYTLLYSFNFGNGNFDGYHPLAGVTFATDGNLYGTTTAGGTANGGTIYKITTKDTETVLYNFCAVSCTKGFAPATPISEHTSGKFYGNTNGNSLGGSVFYSFDVGLKPFVELVLWSGKVGSTVEILGQDFSSTTHVSFNGVKATFKIISDTYLTATVPAGAKTGSVSVATSAGTFTSSHIFLVVPTITTLNPTSGKVGTNVDITGTGLIQATKVTFASGKAAAFTAKDDSHITATVPAGAKTGKIVVTTPGGMAASPGTFTVTP